MDVKEKALRIKLRGINIDGREILGISPDYMYSIKPSTILKITSAMNPHRGNLYRLYFKTEEELVNAIWQALEWENEHGHKRKET